MMIFSFLGFLIKLIVIGIIVVFIYNWFTKEPDPTKNMTAQEKHFLELEKQRKINKKNDLYSFFYNLLPEEFDHYENDEDHGDQFVKDYFDNATDEQYNKMIERYEKLYPDVKIKDQTDFAMELNIHGPRHEDDYYQRP